MRTVTSSVAVALACAASALAPPSARAQAAPPATSSSLPLVAPIVGPPTVSMVTFGDPRGDANGTAGALGRTTSLLLEPIRLSLLGQTDPMGRAYPNCDAHPESAGSATASTSAAPAQSTLAYRLVPALTLASFSQGGCSMDSSVGGPVVMATSLRPNVYLSASAGILHLPHNGPNGTPVTRTQLRGDVVLDRGGGRSLTIGVGHSGRMTGLTVGGVL